jgi:antirestriction protein ArdC
VFRKDSRVLIRAASAAQRAADYIRGKVAVEELQPRGQRGGSIGGQP